MQINIYLSVSNGGQVFCFKFLKVLLLYVILIMHSIGVSAFIYLKVEWEITDTCKAIWIKNHGFLWLFPIYFTVFLPIPYLITYFKWLDWIQFFLCSQLIFSWNSTLLGGREGRISAYLVGWLNCVSLKELLVYRENCYLSSNTHTIPIKFFTLRENTFRYNERLPAEKLCLKINLIIDHISYT